MNVHIRPIKESDYPLLEDFVYTAIHTAPGDDLPPRNVIFEPEIYMYVEEFGTKPGDCGVVAEFDGTVIGMAWTRIIPAFGHIDDGTPELAISVSPEFRGQHVGTRLMAGLFDILRNRGYARTSLSVQKSNPAVRFYRRLGYEIADIAMNGYIAPDRAGHDDYVMVKNL